MGPHNLTPCNKLIRISTQVSVSIAGSEVGNAAIAPITYVAGVQIGPTGFTPVNILTDPESGDFVWIRQIGGRGLVTPSWSFNASGGVVLGTYCYEYNWRGQRPVGENTDMYVSVANYITPSPNPITASCLMQVVSD
jgi:hypothetical protein